MLKSDKVWRSSALEENLKKTSASVEIREEYKQLLEIVKESYGIHKRTREFLEELDHPFVNWPYVLQELRRISLSDFHHHNTHREGKRALEIVLKIYFDIIRQAGRESIKEEAIIHFLEYIRKILSDSGTHLKRNSTLIPFAVDALFEFCRDNPSLMKKGTKDLKSLLALLTDLRIETDVRRLETILTASLRENYAYWAAQSDPLDWLSGSGETHEALLNYRKLVGPISRSNLRDLQRKLEEIRRSPGRDVLKDLSPYLEMPGYYQILNGYLRAADELEKADVYAGHPHYAKLVFLFHVIGSKGLSDIHRNALIEINRSLGKVFSEKSPDELTDFIRNAFVLLEKSTARFQYPDTIISCINTLAREAFKLNDRRLVDLFIEKVIVLGFQTPDIRGVSSDWEVKFNTVHVKNIRAWLEIISMKPRWSKRLLSALIINLKIGGIFVRDTDLLQKDLSALLNSDITPAYNLVIQLAKLFPIYFTEIGSEGELRDISTRMDEITSRRDPLIHFMRKQSHVESNSGLVSFMESIFRYWRDGKKEELKEHLPEEIHDQIDARGEHFDGMQRIFKVLLKKRDQDPRRFLDWDIPQVRKVVQRISGVSDTDRERAVLCLRFYQLLYKKYNIQHVDLEKRLESSYKFDKKRTGTLVKSLKRKNPYRSLVLILALLHDLKAVILSSEKTEAFENIYYKRHIAAGIPSMYGNYREEKFEALGLSLCLQSMANGLFDKMVESLNLKFITKTTLLDIDKYLRLFIKALQTEGIATKGLESTMKYLGSALRIKRFSVDQYLDIFRFISKNIQEIIFSYYIDAHQTNIPIIVQQITGKRAGKKPGLEAVDDEAVGMHSENFIRSMIASSFALQTLDNFVSRIVETLSVEQDKFKNRSHILNIIMSYDPKKTIRPIHGTPRRGDDQVILGNKGYSLMQAASLGFPIPPGFIITTEVFRCREAVFSFEEIAKDLHRRIDTETGKLEMLTGKRLGDPTDPLLFSARSGSAISLPGMMNTFLNVGINEKIAEGLSRKDGLQWTAWDCYRRFLQGWGMFAGLNRDFFDDIIARYKRRYHIEKKLQFSSAQMREIALDYRKEILKNGIKIEEDPREQLKQAIVKVLESWNSPQAKLYRHEMNISDDWGTAVVIQTMVFGNINEKSGSGVVFTRNPKGVTSAVNLYGDYIFGVQGDDIVSGLVETFPISESQKKMQKRGRDISLEKNFPKIFDTLTHLASSLIYEHGFNHQEIEFTFENETKEGLYILQARDMTSPHQIRLKSFYQTDEMEAAHLGFGIGVSGGALCGRAVFSDSEIQSLRSREPDTPLILIRPDTVPDDIGLILQVDGILTARGGSTSHAAVTISRLKKVGVVGLRDLKVYEQKKFCGIDGKTIKSGDFISIDGWSGMVYSGKIPVREEETPCAEF